MDEKEQKKVTKGEEIFDNFVKQYRNWVDPNTQFLALGGDKKGKRMVGNQIHYKTLRGKTTEEYEDVLGAKSYVEALLGREAKKAKETLDMNIKKG